MADYIFEMARGQVAYVEDGYAFDSQNRKRYWVEDGKLLDLHNGKVVGYLTPIGKLSEVDKTGLFD